MFIIILRFPIFIFQKAAMIHHTLLLLQVYLKNEMASFLTSIYLCIVANSNGYIVRLFDFLLFLIESVCYTTIGNTSAFFYNSLLKFCLTFSWNSHIYQFSSMLFYVVIYLLIFFLALLRLESEKYNRTK